ncbi:MAG TPA: hypothetical protein VIG73_09765 [Cerasibacillus sp.]|uniref:hypothetical protein n=1 Tax=Cerasibacillus sp. TaxID=2498711 RepID=UPI002F421AF3
MCQVDDYILEMWKETEEGRKKLEYWNKFKGNPPGLFIGMPSLEEYDDDLVKLMDACIKQNKTWEELLNWDVPDDALY